jgi:putative phosphoesterase
MCIAVISDVHGNRWALEAVLREIDARGITRIVNLGDCVYGPLDPRRSAEMLMSREIATVRGNEDRLVVEGAASGRAAATVASVRAALTEAQMEWLASSPRVREEEGEMLLLHGTPRRDDEYLLQVVETRRPRQRRKEEIAALLTGVQASIVLCGHDHTPGIVTLADRRLVVNPGSVGLQAYEDDLPLPHAMETGMPHGRFCIVSGTPRNWSVEPVVVSSNWEEAARQADRNGRPDWAAWLRTGRARQGESSE